MKSVQAFVSQGIKNQAELQDALYCAMRLEFATIPPYLCAQWSISGGDTNRFVDSLLKMIVKQEMYHFALAGNMLAALGAAPAIDSASFLTSYPADELPGGIAIAPPVDLKPLTHDQVAVFMQIENPQFTPIPNPLLAADPERPATIGDFYDTIEDAFAKLCDKLTFDPHAHFVTGYGRGGKETFAIKNCADAKTAIEQIKSEGEGSDQSPLQPIEGELAHYYRFKELYDGKRRHDDPHDPDKPIDFPAHHPFSLSTKQPSESFAFSQAFTRFMIDMKRSWTEGSPPKIGAMQDLETLGRALITDGIQPEFVWVP